MIIKNAKVFTDNFSFEEKTIYITGGRITRIADAKENPDANSEGEDILDASGLFAVPGLVDIHFHGAVGHDFCDADADALLEIAKYEAANGVLAICPATMSYNEEILDNVIDAARAFAAAYENFEEVSAPSDKNSVASLVGINMEGPFINPEKAGAQNPEYIMKPDREMFLRLQSRSGGLIKLVDMAPEMDGAMEFIERFSKEAVISIAHTACDYDTAKKAFLLGAKHMTHLFNAMPGINHRTPGPIPAAREADAEVEIIADGIHVHPAMVRQTFDMFSEDKVILISDSMEATGLEDGTYQLGGQSVTVSGKKAVLSDDGKTIAGSVTNLFDCMKTAVLEMDIPLEVALRAATINPAKSIGIDKDYGSISVGKFANIVLMDDNLNIRNIINKGSKEIS
ncbi:N-acetylglucosamine-6-phosphate deacetylase [Butyrivibrio sp. VCD2006]|uniref:N-acetylglucosamine-6-phosphate deacetylase n=1 Tax=Butyrivibrio sp. VCD2006 TaxID=1280664 RepID=UPI000410F111|nr:N-acetylglucosamine-6-phosphate deacetylase [Butyrivibrio sp. VCD2006]